MWRYGGDTMETKRAKVGRPKKEIDYALVRRYAQAQCTQEAIAIALKISLATCTKDPEFIRIYFEGKEEGKNLVLMAQFKAACNGNTAMLSWFGKQHLKQADKVESKNEDRVTIVISGEDANV
jgi:hypothetical protein